MGCLILPPDEAVLCRFLLGQLPPDERESVEQYLDAHPELASTLNALRATDPLLDALRSARSAPPDSAELSGLIGRISALIGPPAVNGAPLTASGVGEETRSAVDAPPARTADPTNPAGPDADLAELLAPPRGPDELGRLAGYRVFRVLGRGGMGAVFEAEEVKLGRRVALKVMLPALAASPTAKKRFLLEARTAARVEHDHVVPIFQVGEDRGKPFIAMPFLRGESLADRLRGRAPFPAAEVLLIGRQVAEGLAAAHAAGLTHRDIKPSNIWLEAHPDGTFKRVRILDFGLARSVGEPDPHLTRSGAILGTPAYMAPEQGRGLPADHRSDLFSLGGVLYEMATGRRAFTGADTFAQLTALATETPPSPRDVDPAVPAALSALIDRLLTRDPAGRPQSVQEVSDQLIRIATDLALCPVPVPAKETGGPGPAPVPSEVWAGVAGEATEPAAARPAAVRRGSNRLLWAAVGVMVLGLTGLGAYHGKTIVRVATNHGDLVVEVDDPAIEVQVKQGAAVVVDKTKNREFVLKGGAGEVEFFDPETGAKAVTRKFEIVRGEKTVVRASMGEVAAARPKPKAPPPPSAPAPAAERKALEWVLSVGGALTVDVAGRQLELRQGDALPGEPFAVLRLSLAGVNGIDDDAVEHLRASPRCDRLELRATAITDGGLAKLLASPGFTGLTGISLAYTGITDSALASIKKLRDLKTLDLPGTQVTSAGLEQLGNLALENLALADCRKVDDAGMAHLARITPLNRVWLANTGVTDEGLKTLSGLANLHFLQPGPVTDRTPEVLARFRGLEHLDLIGSGYTGADLKAYAALLQLKVLMLDATQVADAQLAALKDFPALQVLGLNGNGERVTDAGLEAVARCQTLTFVGLRKTQVTETGVKTLAVALPGCTVEWDGGKIEPLTPEQRQAVEWVLSVGGQVEVFGQKALRVRDKGELPTDRFVLSYVNLYGVKALDDAALDRLRDLPAVTTGLGLGETPVTDAGIEKVAGFPNMQGIRSIGLASTGVTDAGLEFVARCKTLTHIGLKKTGVTEAGVRKLSAALPQCTIEWDGGRLEPLTPEQRQAVEWVLSAGGQLELTEQKPVLVRDKAALPAGPFTLNSVNLYGVKAVDDAAVDRLRALPVVTTGLGLGETSVTDAGIEKVAGFPNMQGIRSIGLASTGVTSAGLSHLAKLPHLDSVGLIGTQVDGAGLARLKGRALVSLQLNQCKQIGDTDMDQLAGQTALQLLNLRGTNVGDAGVRRLAGLARLRTLTLSGVGDAALETVARFKELDSLTLADAAVTPGGLAGLATLPGLKTLHLIRADRVNDAEIERLAGLKGLTALTLVRVPVTEAGVKKLAAARPDLRITWGTRVIGPKGP